MGLTGRPTHRGVLSGEDAPAYAIRVSPRARRVRLVISIERGLEVVVPRGFDRRRIPELVESKRLWIERAAERMAERRRRLEAEPPRLPERIVLPAVNEEWEVEYRPGPVRSGTAPAGAAGARTNAPVGSSGARRSVVVRERPERHLLVVGDSRDVAACRDALLRWLSRRARRALLPRLAVLSYQHRLQFGRASVRQQRTRWGSCSRSKSISLNAGLLFLPPEVVDYVLVHELCHTLEMNHSPRFWALLEIHDPEYRAHKKLLRGARGTLPTWLDGGLAEPVE